MLQWAMLLTLPNAGTQSPCTLVQVAGEHMPAPPKYDSPIDRVIQESRAELFEGPDPSDEARAELRALRAEITALKTTKVAKAELLRRLDAASSRLSGPGVIAHVAVERLGRHLSAAATEAKLEAQVSATARDHGRELAGEVVSALPAASNADTQESS